MTSYTVSGNVREQLGAEGAVEISAAQADAISVVAENIDAIVLVADSLAVPGFSDLASVTAACLAAQTAAQNAALSASQSAADSAAAAASVGASAATAEAWARLMGAPVEGTDVSAKQSAQDADSSATQADFSADAAGTYATSAAAAELLAEAYASAPPGTEVEPGKFSIPTYVDQMQTLLGQAPVLAGRYITTAGIAGVETINFAATDFFRTVEVNRAAGHDVKFKCVQGLFTGPPPSGLDRSYAWIHVIRRGAGAVTIEGPNDPAGGTVTTVFRPKRIARGVATRTVAQLSASAAAVTGTLAALAVPSGTGRRVVIFCHALYWPETPDAALTHTTTITCANIVGLVRQRTVGQGTNDDANPVLTEMWVGTLADGPGGTAGPAFTDLGVSYSFGGWLARGQVEVYVFQDTSGIEADAAKAVSGAPVSIAQAFVATTANGVILASSGIRKDASKPVALAGAPVTTDADDLLWQSTTGLGTVNDIAIATVQDAGLAAATYTLTATPAVGNPGTLAGLVLKPRTVTTTTTGDDGLVTDSARPFGIPAQGGHAMVLAASDGTTWYADQ